MAIQDPVALLNRLLKEDGEAEWLEFKHNNANLDMIGKCVAACANAAILTTIASYALSSAIIWEMRHCENASRFRLRTISRCLTLLLSL